jgi:hypothetical protein
LHPKREGAQVSVYQAVSEYKAVGEVQYKIRFIEEYLDSDKKTILSSIRTDR